MSYSLSNLSRNEGDPQILHTGPGSMSASDRMARRLGWFSIALGLTEVFAPGVIARQIGLRGRQPLLRWFGLRELMAGVLTLSVDKPTGLWSRVLGDALDIATVLPALNRRNPKRGAAVLALLALGGVAIIDAATAQAATQEHRRRRGQRRSYRDRSGFPKGIQAAKAIGAKSREAASVYH